MPPDSTPAAIQAYCEIDFPDPAGGGRLRQSFDAAATLMVATTPDQVPELLARVEAFARDGCWAVGFVAYEAAGGFDAALATRGAPPASLPYAAFAIYRGAASTCRQRSEFLPGIWKDETPRECFDAGVAGIRRGIEAGDYYQVNLTTRLRARLLGDPLAFFDSLRTSQPDAWCAYLDFGRWQVCSVSPELFFHWGADGDGRSLTSRPMKGTAARDADPVRDEKSALALRRSPKECAENLMIVDLIRNDLSRVARLGTVAVPRLLAVEAWPTVWQMTSTVSCLTRQGTTLAGVFGALFPCGSVTGAPKRAAMAAIAAMEPSLRGVYCGAVGVVKPGGEALFSVGIRTAVVDAEQGVAECGIGSGITLDSDADGEWAEWQMKQLFLRRACPDYELLETLRLHGGRYWLRRGHLRRLARSAAALGFEFDGARIEAALAAAAAKHPAGQWRARLRLSPGGDVHVEVFALDALAADARVVLADGPVASGNPWLRHKTTRRGFYDALAADRAGVFDTLLCNERNELTEFTRGNLVLDLGNGPVTPPLACGLLPGVLREALLVRKRVREQVLTSADLARARHLWFVNSVRGAVAVRLAD
jgi:para-aminobenzoate synthetase/4-amino-4-deoxychorismate lyase